MARGHECDNFRKSSMNRRQLLRIGGLGTLGFTLPELLRVESAAATGSSSRGREDRVKSCILLFYYGGPSHQDTWDMKPDAPQQVRGEFQPISTIVTGLPISEQLPRTAKVCDKLAIVRSVHHRMADHNAAAFETLCGHTPLNPKGFRTTGPTDPPCYGSALTYLLPDEKPVPPHVALPHIMRNVVKLPGQTAGFLGSAYDPMHVTRDPNDPQFRVGEMGLPEDLTLEELEHRQSILRILERQARGWEQVAGSGAIDAFYERAFTLLRSPTANRAFDLAQEDPRTRDRYGRTKHGQCMLLARRLVEAGVRFVSIYDGSRNGIDNWDTHADNFKQLKNTLLPPADQAYSALLEDLNVRGLLDSTLVLWMGEFGRTPRVNDAAGRDHWPACFSVVVAGGGVKGGTTYGSSDKFAAYPESDGVTPGDLAATIFWRFGLDPASEIRASNGQTYRLAEGVPLCKLF